MVCLVDFRERGWGGSPSPAGGPGISPSKKFSKITREHANFGAHFRSIVYCLGAAFSEEIYYVNNLPYSFENVNKADDMVVTASPANADRTGYQTNWMCSYFRRIHIQVVNVLCVLYSSKKLFAHCPTPALHTQCARFWR